MVAKYLDYFNITRVLPVIFVLSVHFTLPMANAQDVSIHIRDSLLLHLSEIEAKTTGSSIDKERVDLFKNLIFIDTRIIHILNDSISNLQETLRTSDENNKYILVGVNNKLDMIDDRKTKLERTVLILILVLMMLTYYIFKLQRKNSESGK